jgi:hypothetical protein
MSRKMKLATLATLALATTASGTASARPINCGLPQGNPKVICVSKGPAQSMNSYVAPGPGGEMIIDGSAHWGRTKVTMTGSIFPQFVGQKTITLTTYLSVWALNNQAAFNTRLTLTAPGCTVNWPTNSQHTVHYADLPPRGPDLYSHLQFDISANVTCASPTQVGYKLVNLGEVPVPTLGESYLSLFWKPDFNVS